MPDVPRFERKTAFRVNRVGAVNQTFVAGAEATINYATIEYDLGNNFDLTNDWYVAPLDGIYVFSVRTETIAQANAAGRVVTRLFASAVELIRGDDNTVRDFVTNDVNSWGINGMCYLTAGQQVRATLFAVSGPNQLVQTGSANYFFTGYRIQTESRTILGG